jgi:hypothetical protein
MEMRLHRFFLYCAFLTVFAVFPVCLTAVTSDSPGSQPDNPLWTRLFVLESVRERSDFTGSVEVNYPADRGSELKLLSLELLHEGKVYHRQSLSEVMKGDGGWYTDLIRNLEKLPPEVSFIITNRKYLPADYHKSLTDGEKDRIHRGVLERVESAREDPYFALNPPTRLIKFPVPVKELVSTEEFEVGLSVPITVRIRYTGIGMKGTLELNRTITVAEPYPGGPESFVVNETGKSSEVQGGWYYGDLHVHDCKDETSIVGERGCPTCYAETLNWGDDNQLGEMKDQYVAKGANWFTITSHSYCVESENEYNSVASQADLLSDPSFLVIPDSELQSEEEGSQEGEDTGDLLCWNGVNHMGAHWITSWKPGGQDGLFELCDEPIHGFRSNIRDIRAEGGFGVINHPAAASWAWNSFEYTHGFTHEEGLRGVEIWNYAFMQGQGGAVNWWVRKLLDGEPMYAYAGSDTHDDVFDFGWNHAFVIGSFNSNSLREALIRGRLFISNYQSLVILIRDLDTNRRALMGGGLTINSDSDIELSIYYGFGSKTGNIQIYKGVVGDSAESLFHQENGVTGSGWLYIQDPSPTTNGFVYYRAYSTVTSGGDFSAYSNPVWARVLPAFH